MLSTRSSFSLRVPLQVLRTPVTLAKSYSDDQSPSYRHSARGEGRGGYVPRDGASPIRDFNRDGASRYSGDRRPRQQSSGRQPAQDDKPFVPSKPRAPRPETPPHLLTLADLKPSQISAVLKKALTYKHLAHHTAPFVHSTTIQQTLKNKTVALMFSKRSTRTRVASETGAVSLGGEAMFLGKEDIQLGVNESLLDTAKVIGSMVDGIMARVGDHSEVEGLVEHSGIPVVNALSSLYHPTQILADLLTLIELYTPALRVSTSPLLPSSTPDSPILAAIARSEPRKAEGAVRSALKGVDVLDCLKGKKIAWVGDTNNVLNDMLVSMPRLGMTVAVASPKGYDQVDERVWKRVLEGGASDLVHLTNSPAEALKDADIVVTDTWISMGQETEKAARLAAFEGYQITNEMVESAGAKKDWTFMHCLPRKQEEVNDEVFYGDRSVVFQEAENRKWTIMACFDMLIGRWQL